jgi:hypothetical protein
MIRHGTLSPFVTNTTTPRRRAAFLAEARQNFAPVCGLSLISTGPLEGATGRCLPAKIKIGGRFAAIADAGPIG